MQGGAAERELRLPRHAEVAEQRILLVDADAAVQVLRRVGDAEPALGRPELRRVERLVRAGAGWKLDGAKSLVAMAHVADRLLVPARTGPDSCGVFLVDARAPGVTLELTETTARELRADVRLSGVRVAADDVIGDPHGGMDVVAATVRRSTAGLCATQAGICAEALRMTAAHVSEREQFGQKIATFQAVAQRAADAFIDTEAVTLTSRQAAWLLANGRAGADEALDSAKFWASEGGFRVAHATVSS